MVGGFFVTPPTVTRAWCVSVLRPPEFAGAKPLPPGIQRKIARGGALPPGIAKRYMPGDLLAQLPKRPGQEWILAGTDLVIVEVATRIIVDVLKDAVRSG